MGALVNPGRIRVIKEGRPSPNAVVYWMSRDQRVHDNWALLFAEELARRLRVPLVVVFCLVPRFLGASIRQYAFMIKGLQKLEKELQKFHLPFFLLTGDPVDRIPDFVNRHKVGALVTDFSPLQISVGWKKMIARRINIPFYEVDAHNIVPCWVASDKQEYGAHTFRPKIRRLLPEYLQQFPSLRRHRHNWKGQLREIEWKKAYASLKVDNDVPEVEWLEPGEKAALKMLNDFVENRLSRYHSERNDPSRSAQSHLSPHLHFGQISAQRVALEVQDWDGEASSRESFLEELVVRRELSDNFCLYNPAYSSFEGFPNWARRTLDDHRGDKREHLYSLEELESARTDDELWNAAQTEMVISAKMHGYMRMYWAKKILEWTKSPEEAMRNTIYLNDKYELDGRDPNGYAGIAWSVGGVHDRPWGERKIFGKVRYMSYEGCRRKFDVQSYIQKVKKLTAEAKP